MKISIIAPCFVPWLGYFEQIAVGDIFVYMDDIQYKKRNWRNTNQLKTRYGTKRIHVPVKPSGLQTKINEAEISYKENWEETIINKLSDWYKYSPHSNDIIDIITPVIHGKFERLVDFNFALNNVILTYLGISTPIRFSSEVPQKTNDRNERIIEICQYFGADILYNGKSAASFIDMDLFRRNGIEVVFQDYQHQPYRQLWGEFIPYMSILDLIMNEGKKSRQIIMSSPLPTLVA